MLKTDADTLRALTQLSPVVRKWLTTELMRVLNDILTATEPIQIGRLQGRAQVLQELLNAAESGR